jgi:2-hydroxychromene-2-carboxylate isomerase
LQILRDRESLGIGFDCPEIQAGLLAALKLAIQELKDQTKTGDVPLILEALKAATELGMSPDSPEAQAAWAAIQVTLSAAMDAAIKAGDRSLAAYIAAQAEFYGFDDLAQRGANYAGISIP